jgi:3'(2'), 5'-bisphosphate nucleotidase
VSSVFPVHGVVSEESAEQFRALAGTDVESRVVELVRQALGRPVELGDVLDWIDHGGGSAEPLWAIDPIDGTKGFLRGDQFAVAIGLIRSGEAVGGVLACPNLPADPAVPGGRRGVVFWGGPGIGAFREPIEGGRPVAVAVSEVEDPAGVRVLGSVEAAHGDPALVREVIERAGLGGAMVRVDSQAKYGMVAMGAAEVYLRPRSRPSFRDRIWDHAAGAAIVAGAGGRVTDVDGEELDFSVGSRLERNRGVLATNGAVHDLLLEVLREAERR